MSFLQWLKVIAAVGTITAGLPALFKPESIYGFTGLHAPAARGTSEIRAILGGLLIGMGAAPLILNKPAAYQMLGIAYIAIAIARLASVFIDKSYDTSNLVSLAVEIVFGVILVLPEG